MKRIQIIFAALLVSMFAASCGSGKDGEGTALDSTEIGPNNKADSYKDTGALVEDPNNTLNANPVNDTTVKPETVNQ